MATGKTRSIQINTALGADVLLLERFSGSEELGRLFEYQASLVSEKSGIKPEDLLGTNATVLIQTEKSGSPRYINGFITQFEELGESTTTIFSGGRAYAYKIVLRPQLWFATCRADCRVFQKKSVIDIVKSVVGDLGFSVTVSTQETHSPWEYCVQYRETDFNFISRLLEHEGIYYFFKHNNGSHEMVLADSMNAHSPASGFEKFPFHQGQGHAPGFDCIGAWTATTTVQPGKFIAKDWNFYSRQVVEGAANHVRSFTFGDLEIYDYPFASVDVAGDEQGEDSSITYATARLDEYQSRYRVFKGSGNVRGLAVGRKFSLTDHVVKAYDADYLVVASTLSAGVSGLASGAPGEELDEFKINFQVMPVDQAFRAQRLTPKPSIQGAQTALVVGNGEIDPDKYGRVKVQFHWDRVSKPCWVRVAQSIAGKTWGAVFIPRVGQEVVVDFLEGDPDRPLITGVVYNGQAMPPYALPGEKTKSTIKTNSSEGGGGFNEFRFEDKKGSEQVFLHGERQMDVRVKKDSLEYIGGDRHLHLVGGRFEKIEGDAHLHVLGDDNNQVDGTQSLKVGQDWQSKIGSKAALDAGQEIYLKAGMNLILEAGVQITLKVGGNFINISPAGIDIQGTLTNINSGGSPGSGSGCSPTAPTDPKDADDAKAGSSDDAPPKPQPPKPGSYSPAAVQLKAAADAGAPLSDI